MSKSVTPLVDFYNGLGPNYLIEAILNEWDDDEWDNRHNFIQWVFPTSVPSKYNPTAPVLDAVQAKILADEHWHHIYDAVNRFEGFLINTDSFRAFNHNFLRISRVLQSTREMGLDKLANRHYRFVTRMLTANYSELDADSTLQHWDNASKSSKLV
jgi:hypothetical protein